MPCSLEGAMIEKTLRAAMLRGKGKRISGKNGMRDTRLLLMFMALTLGLFPSSPSEGAPPPHGDEGLGASSLAARLPTTPTCDPMATTPTCDPVSTTPPCEPMVTTTACDVDRPVSIPGPSPAASEALPRFSEMKAWRIEANAAGLGSSRVGRMVTSSTACMLFSSGTRLLELTPGVGFRTVGSLPEAMDLDLVSDLDGDGLDEAFCSFATSATAAIHAIDGRGRVRLRCQAEATRIQDRDDSRLRARSVLRLDPSTGPVLLATMETGYGLQPRGLYAFDGQTGALKWRQLSAPKVTTVLPCPGKAASVAQILVGTYSPGNGARLEDGSTDMKCYVFSLDLEGRLRWRTKVGGHFTESAVLDLRSCPDLGAPFGVRVSAMPDFRPEVGEILLLDESGAIVARHDLGMSCSALVLRRGTPGRGSELLAFDRSGRVHVLGPRLKLLRQRQVVTKRYESIMLQVSSILDLNGDGVEEIVGTMSWREFVSGQNPRSDGGPPNLRRYHDVSLFIMEDPRELHVKCLGTNWMSIDELGCICADLNGDGATDLVSTGPALRFFLARPARRGLDLE